VKAGGLVLVIAGVWVLCQVLGGDALARLGVAGPVEPDRDIGVPVPDDGYGPGFRDGNGRPL
jgi:hypothetical protein